MSRGEVWVTGTGAVSAAGVGSSSLVRLLLAGRDAMRPLLELDGRPAGRAPEVRPSSDTHRLDRAATLFYMAAREAWADARLSEASTDPVRCAVIEGSSLGPLSEILRSHTAYLADPRRHAPRPSGMIRFMTGAGSVQLAQALGIRGPVYHVSAGSVSSMCAIVQGIERIAAGQIDLAIVGGAECPLHPVVVKHFVAARILASSRGRKAGCRPFDRRRCGTVLGEGAGVLVLESASHARRRGAEPRAVVRGFGQAREEGSMTSPDPEGCGVAEAVRSATAAVDLRRIAWIKAHGTGTPSNDAAEVNGLARVFGDRLRDTPITSVKPAVGHVLGASGSLEAVAVVLALGERTIPPTLGTRDVDPALPPCHVPLRAESSGGSIAVVLAQGFGGRCGALTLERA